jgi:hypothetical protein
MKQRHIVIPDTQVKPNVDVSHLGDVGRYIAEKKPDVIVHLGDHWDMPSLSSYDKGKRSAENRRYIDDIKAGNEAMQILMAPIRSEQARLKRNKEKLWKPRMLYLMGNHEQRIERYTNDIAALDGAIGYNDLDLSGWDVRPFLAPVVVDGVAYCHYFTSGIMGRPVTSATALLTKKHMSAVMGHVQDRGIAYAKRADGQRMTGIFAGICYTHDEEYLNPQGNGGTWRGIWVLNQVVDGSFDEMPVSLDYLRENYNGHVEAS